MQAQEVVVYLQKWAQHYCEPDPAAIRAMAILVPPCHPSPWWSAHMRAALAPEVMGRRSMCGSNPMQIPAPMGQNILLVEVTCTHALQ